MGVAQSQRLNLSGAANLTQNMNCAYCGKKIDGEPEFTVERDGYGEGPEVPLCRFCASGPGPSLNEIWQKIANPDPLVEAIKELYESGKVK